MSRLDAIRKEKERSAARGAGKYIWVNVAALEREGITEFKTDMGENVIAIIPPEDLEIFYNREVGVHQKIGVDGATVLCPERTFDTPCPICEEYRKISARDVDDEQLDTLYVSRRYLYFIVDVSSKAAESKGIRWFNSPASIHDGILAKSKNRATGEPIDVSDPDKGKDVVFEKIKKGGNTSYMVTEFEDRYPIPKEWLDIPTFDEVLTKRTYDELYTMLHGVSSEEKSADETPRRSRRTKEEASEEEAPTETRRSRRDKREEPKEESVEEPKDSADEVEKAADIKEKLRRRKREDDTIPF